MLQKIEDFYGHTLTAIDGEIGRVQDFYFDDVTWGIRYLVVDTGPWLSTQQVLLSPHAFGALDADNKSLQIRLTRHQIEQSPSIEARRPVSQQYEIDHHRYYGWPAYWARAAALTAESNPVVLNPPNCAADASKTPRTPDDRHLCSTRAVKGHRIEATDGEIGKVAGFMVDDKSWAIRELVVEAGHWYKGKEVLITPDKVERISPDESMVVVALAKSDIEHTAEARVVHDSVEKRAAPDYPTD